MSGPRRAGVLSFLKAESPGDAVFKVIAGTFGIAILALFGAVLWVLVEGAWPAMRRFGFGFLASSSWDPDGQQFGALPYVVGTIGSSVIAIALAVPVALAAAVALTQILPARISQAIGTLIELLAAIPSIVFGIWGLAVVVPIVRTIGPEGTFGRSILSAGIVLAVMVLPIIAAISRDMLRAVPVPQREAALAVGATDWEVTWRVILPSARPGILAAILLGFGRAFGETMAVIFVIGNQPLLPRTVFDPAATIASVIANEFGDPSGPIHFASLVYLGLVLLLVSLVINLAARRVVRYLNRRGGVMA
jgi:phosphate transport system permease protein